MAASQHSWTIDGALALATVEPGAIPTARQRVEQQLEAVPADGERRAQWESALDERLRRLAVKIAPGMSVAQADAWRKVMTEALGDLPAMVALTAAKRAIHRPMQFLNEIEGVVREIAADMITRRKLALLRLDALRDEIERASQPKLPDPAREPWTEERVGDANAIFARLGIKTRYRLVDGEVEPFEVVVAAMETSEGGEGNEQA